MIAHISSSYMYICMHVSLYIYNTCICVAWVCMYVCVCVFRSVLAYNHTLEHYSLHLAVSINKTLAGLPKRFHVDTVTSDNIPVLVIMTRRLYRGSNDDTVHHHTSPQHTS